MNKTEFIQIDVGAGLVPAQMKFIKKKIDGVLLLDKPNGISSNAALQKAKRLFQAKKAGHTGSLDPLATGMLPLCFGEATKFSQYLLDSDKKYSVSAKLGIRTDTSDSEGEIISKRIVPSFTMAELNHALNNFRGEILQTPSMYSAIKYQGQPLYKLARKGITVEREQRKITISNISVIDYSDETLQFEIDCSKGTYVRTLVDDLGEQLGCGAHVTQLRRLQVGGFPENQMISFERLENSNEIELRNYLLPIDAIFSHWPKLHVSSSTAFYLRQGQSVLIPKSPREGFVCLYMNEEFLGIGEVLESMKIAPRRLVV